MQTYRQYFTLLENADAVNTIISVAELLRSEAEGEGDAKTSMNSFLNMLRNAGLNINYDGLKAYYDAEPRLQSEIQDFNEKEVVFVGDAEGLDMKPSGEMPPEKKVNSMAKKALAKRESINEDNNAMIMGFVDKWIESGQPDDYKDDLVAYVKEVAPNDARYLAGLIMKTIQGYQERKKNGSKSSSLMGLRKISKSNEGVNEMIDREIKNGKMYISRADFKKVHSDYKNDTPGKERMLGLDPDTGGTTSYEVVFTDLGPGADGVMYQIRYLPYDSDKFMIVKGFTSEEEAEQYAKGENFDELADEWDIEVMDESVNEAMGSAFGGTIDKMQYIVDTKSAMEVDGVMVDTFTASLIMDIFNKVNKDNQDKMRKMPVEKLANAAYKLADRVGEDVSEGYYEMPPMDKDKYQERDGLEGPFQTRSGKVVYYDPKEGSYYDPDSDIYMSYEEFMAYDKSKPDDFEITKMELPKKESVDESFDYWQSPESIATLAGVKKK